MVGQGDGDPLGDGTLDGWGWGPGDAMGGWSWGRGDANTLHHRVELPLYVGSFWRHSGRDIVNALALAVPERGDWGRPLVPGMVRTKPMPLGCSIGLPPP